MICFRPRIVLTACIVFFYAATPLASAPSVSDPLAAGFETPPDSAKVRAYWWWLNGNATEESITRDLEGMRAKGFGGAILCDAGGAEQRDNAQVPHGPTFFTPEWRALYRHALHEADRLGLELSLNIQSGWNVGGPVVQPADATKQLVWSEISVRGSKSFSAKLPEPSHTESYYRDFVVLAFPDRSAEKPAHASIQNLAEKAVLKSLHFSAPDTSLLLKDIPATPGEEDFAATQVVNLTTKMTADGTLQWEIPSGAWTIQRFGYTVGGHGMVSTSSEGWQGYAVDVLDQGAFRRYWDAIVEPLI
ncbi:MAG TPA: glycosyl hydrolase, partial [Opitutaceae bacterium]|nr:glycosyl hydrolase [Opitutaceae bacterium]